MNPPKYFLKFFKWFCAPGFFEELEGDLEENFHHDLKEKGLSYARKKYRKEVILMMRPSVIKRFRWNFAPSNSTAMYANYLKIAFRNLKRHSLFSFINISGLAISMSIGLLIIGMIGDLMRFDEFHEKKDRIYRVISTTQYGHYNPNENATCALPLAQKLKEEYQGIAEVVRIKKGFYAEAEANEKILPLNGYFTDNSFATVFSFDWIAGNPKTALLEPFSIIITQKTAEKIFGNQDPMGEVITMGKLGDYRITGILKDPPKYSHLQFEILGSMATVTTLENQEKISPSLDEWTAFWSNYVYVLLVPNQTPYNIQDALNIIAQEVYTSEENLQVDFDLQSLSGIVPGPDLSNQIGPKMIYLPIFILSGLAFLILLSACFNYTNLSIARSLKRATEVGIRKVIGATRKQIFAQFITETLVISILALGLSALIFEIIKPEFLSTIPRASSMFDMDISWEIGLTFMGFAILAGFMAGLFPSLFLARMEPVMILRSVASFKVFKGIGLRKVLTVFQFCLSLIFILAVSIIYRQYQFSINYDMGFAQENILNIQLQGNDPEVVTQTLEQIPEISQISLASMIPGTGTSYQAWAKQENIQDSLAIYYMHIDPNYLENLKISLIAGENFATEKSFSEERYVIVNEEFTENLGWENSIDALGKWIKIDEKQLSIIGVVNDFNYNHLEEPIESFCFRYNPNKFNYINAKISSNDVGVSMNKIQTAWEKIDSRHELKAHFFDDQIDEAYGFYHQMMKIFGFFAFLAISIACLGLLGMAVFSVETRIKEIGVRKILGASEYRLVYLLSKGFVKLLLIATFIAVPIAYLFFDQILLNLYAFRINIGFSELSFGLFLVFIIGFVIIASQTFRAARMNPADTLRNE